MILIRRLLVVLALLAMAMLPFALSAARAAEGGAAATAASAGKQKAAKKKKVSKRCRAARRRVAGKKGAARKRAIAKRRKACRTKRRKRRARRPVAAPAPPAPAPVAARSEGGADDVTVVAVLDGGLNPYHWDFLASKMPQHQDADPGNDLPLDRPATEWLPGAQGAFTSFDRLDLTLEGADPDIATDDLAAADEAALAALKRSGEGSVRGHWIPGTKVIGAVSFSETEPLYRGTDAHGAGTTSSAVGNLHGTCPECLLVFVDYGETSETAEAAIEWAESQPWIDVISNSYGHGGAVPKIYAGSDVERQRAASERGQTIVFSAGNGIENAFQVANPTSYSSQKGPDWIVTVGGVAPSEANYYGGEGDGGSFSGAGKPADVAGVANAYPNAYDAATVGGTGSGFSGTSNAAPVITGLYSRALWVARTRLAGPSRMQAGGTVAAGAPVPCAAARPDCELGDGLLTAGELRTRLMHGAIHTSQGMTVYTAGGPQPTLPPVGEEEFLNEGHGTYWGREAEDREAWLTEFDRIVAPMEGRAPALERPAGEREWMTVDSYCRQENWGAWAGGYYVEGVTPLPGPDLAWPLRSAYEATCPGGPTPAG